MIFAGPVGGQPAPDKMAFLQVPEMIKIGDTWKFVELPRAVAPDKPIVAAEGGIRSWLFRDGNAAGAAQDPEVERRAEGARPTYDQKNAQLQVAEARMTSPGSTSAGSPCSAPSSRPPGTIPRPS